MMKKHSASRCIPMIRLLRLMATGILVILSANADARVGITTVQSAAKTPDPDAGQDIPDRNFHPTDMLPIDEPGYAVATQTGGDFYFWAPGEFSTSQPGAGHFIAEQTLMLDPPLLYEFGDLSAERPEERVFEFMVPAGRQRITVFSGLQSRERITILQPDQQPVTPETAEDDVHQQVYDLTYMRLAVITQPRAGTWSIRIKGRGKFLLSVK